MDIAIERGKSWAFASALDWPGLSRRGKGAEGALAELERFLPRYQLVLDRVDLRLDDTSLMVVDETQGNATTDFGAPDVPAPQESADWQPGEKERHLAVLSACWEAFDAALRVAPQVLPKGPRGGGRDAAEVVDHVVDSERRYARKVGVNVPIRSPWPEQRRLILSESAPQNLGGAWSQRYWIRRTAWHVLDHVWELEDKTR